MANLLAVLLPVRDGEETLWACLQSLREQTFRDFRVIAVDDGSVDETPRILHQAEQAWTAEGPPFMEHFRVDPGRGVAGALVAAAGRIQGESLIARQDADDLSFKERLARQAAFLGEHPDIEVLGTDIETVRSGPAESGGVGDAPTSGWLRYEAWLSSCHTPEEIARNLWIESPLPHPTVMMRRTALEMAGGYREVPWPEDYDLWLRMLRLGIPMAKLPEVLYQWRDHPARASRTQEIYASDRFLACRAHHLARYLTERETQNPAGPPTAAGEPGGPAVILWGAGRDGRRAAKALMREGVRIECFLDIDPKKIGRRAYERPIVAAEDWLARLRTDAGRPRPPVLAAVGTRGARELIRARCEAAGLVEGADFLCIA